MTTPPSDRSWVVTGNPTPQELAAVVAVLSARPLAAHAPATAPVSHWNDRAALLRRPMPQGPGAWRSEF